jgi:hypothetical protein
MWEQPSPMRRLILLFVLLSGAPTALRAAVGGASMPPQTASHLFGFSGATLSIREAYPQGWPVAQRTFLLRGPSGRRRGLPLHPGGGKAGNQSLNLFKADGDRYLLTSERDCVEFDPIRLTAGSCVAPPLCAGGHLVGATYLGRFDWMNGFDAPKGDFGLAFRFLGFEDADESGSCPKPAPA